MSYPLLRQRDILPAVGVLQKLLNRTGGKLHVDGNFGPRTKAGIQSFQRPRGLGFDGVVGINTWPRLVANEPNLKVIDCIDIFDPDLESLEARDIRSAGGNPIVIGGMSNGIEEAVRTILSRVQSGSVFLLRFHGHGLPGNAGISDGTGGFSGEHRSSIHTGNLTQIIPIIRRLRPIFGPYGCAQFMHCQTGRGPSGRQLLSTIANHLGVPATAAIRDQLGGGLTTFRFEGSTHTALPGGISLKLWCQRLPNLVPMTVS